MLARARAFPTVAKKSKPPFSPAEELAAFRELDRLKGCASQAEITRQRNKILERNLGLIWSHAISAARRATHFELEDLFGYGVLGCMTAIDKFRSELGNKFSTYGGFWIRQAIQRSIADHDAAVRIPVHLRDAKTKLMRTEQTLTSELGGEKPDQEHVAQRAGLAGSKLERVRGVSFAQAVSLDAPVLGRTNETELTRLDMLTAEVEHPVETIASIERERLAQSLVGTLSAREKHVVMGRSNGLTLSEVGDTIGRTRERVRQIENTAMKKMRKIARLRGVVPDSPA